MRRSDTYIAFHFMREQYIERQVAFGPRVPNTEAHRACGEYLAGKLKEFGAKVYDQYADVISYDGKEFGAKVYDQYADVISYDGKILKARNIIGAYNPDTKKRVLLCAHWDSRPYADADKEAHHHTPIDGANDGASGVGVLLEIARHLQQQAQLQGRHVVLRLAILGTPSACARL